MLDTVVRLVKIEHISVPITVASGSSSYARSATPSSSQWTLDTASPDGTERSMTDDDAGFLASAKATTPYFTAPHRTIVWPAIYTCITRLVPQASSQLTQLAKGGTSWLMYVITKNCSAIVVRRSSQTVRSTPGIDTILG